MRRLRIATRKSPLALWQARHVADLLARRHPGLETSLIEMTTTGDRFLQAPLAEIGGKGMFIKEIEEALLARRADLAVHSLKDVTTLVPGELCIAAIPAREDARDAFVSPTRVRLEEIPRGASIGTSSLIGITPSTLSALSRSKSSNQPRIGSLCVSVPRRISPTQFLI